MDRRQFIGTVTAAAVLSGVASKANAKVAAPSFEGALYLSKAKPGRWAAKAAGHLPNIVVKNQGGKTEVSVTTPHGMSGYTHYIVKHQLFDENMNLLGEKMFDPTKDAPISNFSLPNYSGKLYALSVCNKHDAWLSETVV